MKVLLFADLHLHPHKKSIERLNDCLSALEWVFQTAKDNNVKQIIFCGDLFHDRQKIDILTYHRTFELFEKHVPDMLSVYLLIGNHDLWHLDKWDVSSVFPLQSIKGVTVIDNPCTIDVGGFPISFLPYTTNPLQDLEKVKNKHNIKILCGHLAINGALLNTFHGTRAEVNIEHDGGMQTIDKNIFDKWHSVFLGHYHAAQSISDNTEYIGSPLQLSFGEAFQKKHVLIFDTETFEKTYVENTFSPQHLILPESELGKYKIEGNFLKIVVEETSSTEIMKLKHQLEKQKIAAFEIIHNVQHIEQKQLIEDAKSILLDQGTMIQKYITQCREAKTIPDTMTQDMFDKILNRIIESREKDHEKLAL